MSRNRQGRGSLRQKPLIVEVQQPQKSFWGSLSKFVQRFFMSLGVLFFVMVVGYGYLIASFLSDTKPVLPDEVVLVYHFSGALEEMDSPSSLFGGPKNLSLNELTEALNEGAKDPKVKGFVARISGNTIGSSQLYDVAQSLEKFRAAGKFTYAYSDSIGETGNGMNEYLLASLFDEIWVQPVGSVSITGYNFEGTYFKNLFDKFLIKPEFFQREEYKSAMETFTRSEMSPESKREMVALLKDVSDSYLEKVGARRNLTPAQLKSAIDMAPLPVEQAQELGLIDHVDFVDKLLAFAKAKAGLKDADKQFVSLVGYMNTKQDVLDMGNTGLADALGKNASKSKIAVITMEGPIMSGSSQDEGFSPLASSKVIYSRDYASEITKAADDEDIKAIIIRISSPGGSPSASEAIRRAMVYAREEKSKKVILSMGAMAASGGYWIATAADQIFATDTTITGSIGVLSGKFNIGDALQEYGVTTDTVQYGDNAAFLSPFQPFDSKGKERMNVMLDQIYDAFLDRVAEGRHLDRAKVREIAKGRVWSGKAALGIGLVDKIGGLQDAKTYAAAEIGVAEADVVFEHYPKRKTLIEQLSMMMSGEWAILPRWLQNVIAEISTTMKLQASSPVQVLYQP
ncbi:MAG: signal peptide peptidase SppA [Micavibrio sp.]|nr:signal peptide peptidase SppA [Micavibrio sp.]|tara:strand:- start:4128 stop:6008 length:1881 start_codon:yes stop_codon:yes gene_type:complete